MIGTEKLGRITGNDLLFFEEKGYEAIVENGTIQITKKGETHEGRVD